MFVYDALEGKDMSMQRPENSEERGGQGNVGEVQKLKKGAKIPRQPMPEQAPEDRRYNFDEVPFGYTPELAMLEASRCLDCKKPGVC